MIISGTVDFDCSDAAAGTLRREFGMRDITVEVVETHGYNFTVGGAIESFMEVFTSRNEPAPTFSLSGLGPARIAALSFIAERGFATLETLCENIPRLDAKKAKAIIRELLHQGKIVREARGVYSISDIEEVYHDEIIEFRFIAEAFRPTSAERQVLTLINPNATKSKLIEAMSVSRQRIDQLLGRLVEKGLVATEGNVVRKTAICEVILSRTSIYPL
jgi:predicted transcriptional regulator